MKMTTIKFIALAGLIIAILTALFVASQTPVRSFTYFTSNNCSSDLQGGGKISHFTYSIIDGETNLYEDRESKLESLAIPQVGFCEGQGLAPADYTTIELFLF